MNVLWAFLRKDMLRELRTGEILMGGLAFGLLIVLTVALARPHARQGFDDAVAAVWIAVLFVAQLSIARSIEVERIEGRWETVRSTGIDPSLLYLAKVAVIGLFLCLTAAPITVAGAVLFNLEIAQALLLLPSLALGLAAFAVLGPLIVFLAAASRIKEVVLPFLTIVLFIPIVVLGILSSFAAADGDTWSTASRALIGFLLVTGGTVIFLAPVVIEA